MKKCTALWLEAQFQVKMHKMPQVRSTFGSCNVKKVHGAVARNNAAKSQCAKSRLRSDRETLDADDRCREGSSISSDIVSDIMGT